jgi:hypothetical protein
MSMFLMINQPIHLISLQHINSQLINLISLQHIKNQHMKPTNNLHINNKVTKNLLMRLATVVQLIILQNIRPLDLLSTILQLHQHMIINISQNLLIIHLHNIHLELTVMQILEYYPG